MQCAKHIQGKNQWHFLFVGAGAEKERLLKMKEEEHIDNITMLEPVPKEMVNRYISILDVALINLKKSDLFCTVIPSKIFENAGMEIPILLGVKGEAEDIIKEFNMPSIIVADAGLGTINSTVLTIEYMRSKNLKVNGVILNRFEIANEMHDDNRKMIEEMTGVKIIGVVIDGILKLDEKNIENLFE